MLILWNKHKENSNNGIVLAVIALAIFNFIFLGIEYLFDEMIGYATDSHGVVFAQNCILGVSALGFIGYDYISRCLSIREKKIWLVGMLIVSELALFVVLQHMSYQLTMLAGFFLFFLLGVLGSAVCYLMYKNTRGSRYLSCYIGFSYAIGVFLQFINNNFVVDNRIQTIIIAIAGIAIGWICVKENTKADTDVEEQNPKNDKAPENLVIAGTSLILCVSLMTCIFSTLDNAVTMVHASGSFNIGQWPRLILALSGLAAGLLFDLNERKYMHVFMYMITSLATICIVILQLGGSFIIGLLVFYLAAGFFVVYFTAGFIELARYMKRPKLWVGLGRATNNLCAFLATAISMFLLSRKSHVWIVMIAIVLFALVNVMMWVYVRCYNQSQVALKESLGEADEDKFDSFVQQFRLTDREAEVLKALLESDDGAQELAASLAMSRTALYRHISSLNQKTNTNTRIGMIQFYFKWKSGE